MSPTPSDHPLLPPPAPLAPRPGYVDVPTYPNVPVADETSAGGLLEYWAMLRRRKGMVLLGGFLGLLAAVLVTLPQTPIYQARASLEIQSINQDFMNLRQVSPVADETADYWSNDIQTHVRLLQSTTLLDRVVAKLESTRPRDFAKRTDRLSAWRRALNLPEPTPLDARQQALDVAGKSLKFRSAGQTRVLEILCDSTDARTAADFANTVANEYIDQSLEARWKMNQRTGEFLSRQLEDMRIKLERSEDQLNRYARQSGLLFTGGSSDDKAGQQNISEAKLRQLQEELSRSQADRIAKQSRYELARTSPPDTLADVLNDSSLHDYQAKLTDLRRQEAELGATYRPEYAKVKRVQVQIATMESALARQRAAVVQRIANDYNEALHREKLLAADYAEQARLVTTESEKSVQYNILKREVESTRQIYQAMLQRVKESSIASAMRASNIRIVDLAHVPKVPYKPRLTLNGVLGLFAGLFLGGAFVIVRERADRTLQAPGDAQIYVGVMELGAIPNVRLVRQQLAVKLLRYRQLGGPEKRSPQVKEYPPGENGRTDGSGGVVLPAVLATDSHPAPPAIPAGRSIASAQNPKSPSESHDRVELITSRHATSIAAEAFRVVLTSILFTGENGTRPRVIVITSSGPSEGKTTAACNLAIAIAEIRRRVLLIDADMRKPRMHDVFDLQNDRGLSTVLADRSLDEQKLDGLVQETAVPDVYVLPSGPHAGASLLYSPVMPQLLERFRKNFDMVLIDTPPMLTIPDARVIGKQADAVILVTRAGRTTRDAALAARDRLVEDGTRVLGTILNDWNPRQAAGRYYGYSEGYGYGHYYRSS